MHGWMDEATDEYDVDDGDDVKDENMRSSSMMSNIPLSPPPLLCNAFIAAG